MHWKGHDGRGILWLHLHFHRAIWEFMDCLKAIQISTEYECHGSTLTASPVGATNVAVKNYLV